MPQDLIAEQIFESATAFSRSGGADASAPPSSGTNRLGPARQEARPVMPDSQATNQTNWRRKPNIPLSLRWSRSRGGGCVVEVEGNTSVSVQPVSGPQTTPDNTEVGFDRNGPAAVRAIGRHLPWRRGATEAATHGQQPLRGVTRCNTRVGHLRASTAATGKAQEAASTPGTSTSEFGHSVRLRQGFRRASWKRRSGAFIG